MALDTLDPFWIQLYKNIGYSTEFHRSVVVEPICALFGIRGSVRTLRRLDLLVCRGNRGKHAAKFIDRERSEFLEQWLLPYILDERWSCILLTNETPSEQEDEEEYPPRKFLRSIAGPSSNANGLLGLLHYHVDEPELSAKDLEFMKWFASRAKKLGAPNQLGMIASESDPADSLALRQTSSMEEFVKHMRRKLQIGQVDLVANVFDGSETFHPQVRMEVTGRTP
ncbi:MAG: hypothetical protein L3K14_01555 [Thermoplasmata archaeon]|nr:hypothetical protein [Thermoplasmata archaeon]